MTFERILGPRIPADADAETLKRYRRPTVLFTVAAILLIVSVMLPYWSLELRAPQYPDGLTIRAYVNRLEGDVGELEGLNHYVGLRSFDDAAGLERSMAVAAIVTLGGLLLAGLYIHSRWVLLFAAPAVLLPFFFVADLQFWLWRFGHTLDPAAPFSAAVGEFTPPIFGPAEIAQFDTLALPGIGFIVALTAAGLAAYGLWCHRQAWKPLIEGAAT